MKTLQVFDRNLDPAQVKKIQDLFPTARVWSSCGRTFVEWPERPTYAEYEHADRAVTWIDLDATPESLCPHGSVSGLPPRCRLCGKPMSLFFHG